MDSDFDRDDEDGCGDDVQVSSLTAWNNAVSERGKYSTKLIYQPILTLRSVLQELSRSRNIQAVEGAPGQ